jgi:hypothetical protein
VGRRLEADDNRTPSYDHDQREVKDRVPAVAEREQWPKEQHR